MSKTFLAALIDAAMSSVVMEGVSKFEMILAEMSVGMQTRRSSVVVGKAIAVLIGWSLDWYDVVMCCVGFYKWYRISH